MSGNLFSLGLTVFQREHVDQIEELLDWPAMTEQVRNCTVNALQAPKGPGNTHQSTVVLNSGFRIRKFWIAGSKFCWEIYYAKYSGRRGEEGKKWKLKERNRNRNDKQLELNAYMLAPTPPKKIWKQKGKNWISKKIIIKMHNISPFYFLSGSRSNIK